MIPVAESSVGLRAALARSYTTTVVSPDHGWHINLAFIGWASVERNEDGLLDRDAFAARLFTPAAAEIGFQVEDSVFYPHHGSGRVVQSEARTVFGEERVYLTIKIQHNDMTILVPRENASQAGLVHAPWLTLGSDALRPLVLTLGVGQESLLLQGADPRLAADVANQRLLTAVRLADAEEFVSGVVDDPIVPVEQSPPMGTALQSIAATGGGALTVWLTHKGVFGVIEGGAGIVILYTAIGIGDLIQRYLGSVGPQPDADAEAPDEEIDR